MGLRTFCLENNVSLAAVAVASLGRIITIMHYSNKSVLVCPTSVMDATSATMTSDPERRDAIQTLVEVDIRPLQLALCLATSGTRNIISYL